ncbi:low-specificity L-threonine aldolase [Alisedimentitalea sp. MJ-SS2]|uniref:low-specificity L-threonine aldolase n=1 Tax=Aliisedimentitalea sp. MJ-SS2 TaxID=3049795 RepID=UPI002906F51C|nr:low-specificity L-threonine aldolase [Alisedimentitalea sp. MJ-SS2]MDU8927759.1 low-specificity L-threonine aldolase [Alisedimentitalea sp. MJ-SS2]
MNHYAGATTSRRGNAPVCDLRSDTVTQPDDAMREAMVAAELGDDVFGDDPTVTRLEETLAERTGKEAGLFLTSGTQSNLCAMLAHCGRGEEVIVGRDYHVFAYEAHGASVLGGLALCPIAVADDGGLDPAAIAAEVKPNDSHKPVSRLLSLENTHNGKPVSLVRMGVAISAARKAGLSVHLDGARAFNAAAALGCEVADLAAPVDSVSLCMSKGLGTPAGSVLVGPRDLITKARRWRKMLGGGMRQSGVLAAAALHALEHNAPRLVKDHDRAADLAALLRDLNAGDVTQATNMIFFTPANGENDALRARLAEHDVLILGGSSGPIRIVLHRGVDDLAYDRAIAAIRSFYG